MQNNIIPEPFTIYLHNLTQNLIRLAIFKLLKKNIPKKIILLYNIGGIILLKIEKYYRVKA